LIAISIAKVYVALSIRSGVYHLCTAVSRVRIFWFGRVHPAPVTMEEANGHAENGYSKQRHFSKRPVRPDFTARDAQLKILQAKVKEFLDLSKAKTGELDALQNENKANSKLESLRRALANAVHTRVQTQVRHTHCSLANPRENSLLLARLAQLCRHIYQFGQ
jgi:hypothetical protein